MLWSDRRIRLLTTKEHSGAMVALMLDESDSAALLSALPMGLEPESNLHITLAYLGEAGDLTRQQSEQIDRILFDVGSYREPVTGTVQGVGYFNQDEASQRVLWATYDAPNLPDLRQSVVRGLTEVGLPVDDSHGFTPHITLAYCPDSVDLTVPEIPNLKITFHSLTRMFAGDRADFLLAGEPESFMVKEVAGQYNWVLISSNSYQDRDGEIVTQKALEDDVVRADTDGDYGPLLWWHEKSIVLGQCTGNAMHGRMLVEWGTFKNAAIAEAFKQAAPSLGISIGFHHPITQPDSQGLFHNIRKFERSALPHDVASNPLTAIPLIEKEPIMLKEKIDALRKVFGGDDALVNSVISLADSQQKAADEAGIRTKAKQECEPGSHWDEATQACVKDKLADGAPPVADEKKEFVGDMDPVALKALIVESFGGHIDARLDAVRAEFKAALETQATTKAAHDEANAAALKSYNEKLDGIASSVKSALDGVAELKGELPRALGERLKGFHASTDGEAPPETLKDTGPALDPLAKHWAALHQSNGGQPPVSG